MDQIFNNREIASAIWLLVFAIWMIFKSEVRTAFRPLIKASLNWHILIPILSMILYIVIWVFMLGSIGFWDISVLKDTVFWVLGTAVIIMFRAGEIGKKEGFFKDAILDNLKIN